MGQHKLAKGVKRYSGRLGINAFFDTELFDEVREYAQAHNLAISNAVVELATLGLECLKDEDARQKILRVRENARALLMSTSFDFSQDCFKCGKRGLIRVHSHIQCRFCGAVVEPCCDD